jgi:hypothetical protein
MSVTENAYGICLCILPVCINNIVLIVDSRGRTIPRSDV